MLRTSRYVRAYFVRNTTLLSGNRRHPYLLARHQERSNKKNPVYLSLPFNRRRVIMTFRSIGLLFLALAFAALVSGCGGDSNSDASAAIPTSSIDKAEFVKQANAICKPGKARLVSAVIAYQKKHLNEASVKVVPNAARSVIGPELDAQIEQIRDLGAPSGDAAEIEEFFAALQSGVDEIIAKKPPTFDEAERMLQPADDSARQYGIDECKYVLVDQQFNTRVLNSE
jgi:hypothetical protein